MAKQAYKRPIHQLVNHLSRGDAIGHDVLTIQDRLRAMGHQSEIFCLHHGPGLSGHHRPTAAYTDFAIPESTLLWHFSIGTSLFDLAARTPARVVMRYHNITPYHFFSGISPQLELDCRMGRRQLVCAADFVDLAIGDSVYNQGELDDLGFANTGNCPIMLNLESYNPQKPPSGHSHFTRGGPNILHVGRLMPQKRYEELILAFHFLRRIKPQARLIIVGGWDGLEIYRTMLDRLVEALSLEGVFFMGRVSGSDLRGLFSLSDLYLCLSDHEGFCVPLVEAMKMDLPIVAKDSTAVGETLGEAGVVLKRPTPSRIAEVIAALVENPGLLQTIKESQQNRLRHFEPELVWARLWELLDKAGV